MSNTLMTHLMTEYNDIVKKLEEFDSKIQSETNSIVQDYLAVERNAINSIKLHLEDLLGMNKTDNTINN